VSQSAAVGAQFLFNKKSE